MIVLGGMQERRSYTMTALLAGAGIEEDSCTVATAQQAAQLHDCAPLWKRGVRLYDD